LIGLIARTAARAAPRRKALVRQTDAKTVLGSRRFDDCEKFGGIARPETAKKFCAIIRVARFRFPLNLPFCRAF